MKEKNHEIPASLLTRSEMILSENGYTKECFPLRDLAATIESTENNAATKVLFYKWFGLPLLILIPIISALLSVLMATDQQSNLLGLQPFALYISLTLTLLTILNSIFRPGERFREACLLAIKIAHFKSDFLTALEETDKITDTSLLELVERYRKAFERYQEQLIGLFLPELAGLEYRERLAKT